MLAEEEQDIVIVGGGMSGLAAAHALAKAGISADLYEGRDRLGGRTYTHYFDDKKTQFYEEGGTFIDADHEAMINLAKEMDVELIRRGYGSRNITGLYQGEIQTMDALFKELSKTRKTLLQERKSIDWENVIKCDLATRKWSVEPLQPYLSNLSDFGKKFLQTYYEDETGMSIDSASVYRIDWFLEKLKEYKTLLKAKKSWYTPNAVIDRLGYDYTVKGGMSSLVNAVADRLNPRTIHLSHKLTHIQKDDQYTLTFQSGDEVKHIRAKRVIMTLPFSTLRHVKIADSIGLSDFQNQAIQTLSYGTNSKIGVPVAAKNNLYDDMVYYFNLDTTRCGWPGHNAFTLMVNAEDGEKLDEEAAQAIWATESSVIQAAYPKITSFGSIVTKNWSQDEFSLGSYSGNKHDDDSIITLLSERADCAGMRKFAEPVNDSFFIAGEHTRGDGSAAYIEGAVRSGYKAAELLQSTLRSSKL
jgi:monoamine oxidase